MMAAAQALQQPPLRTPSSAWGTGCPPLCAVRGAPNDVLPGPGPSLQILRRRFPPALVRTLRRYYGPIRLLRSASCSSAAGASNTSPQSLQRTPLPPCLPIQQAPTVFPIELSQVWPISKPVLGTRLERAQESRVTDWEDLLCIVIRSYSGRFAGFIRLARAPCSLRL